MLKKASSFVLASLKGATYWEYASPFRSLRPRWKTFLNILSVRHSNSRRVLPRSSIVRLRPVALLLITLCLVLPGCAVPIEEQKAHIRQGDLNFRVLSPQAFLDTWGKPNYAHEQNTQFFSVGKGRYIPMFRVPSGEAPSNWDSRFISGDALFLVYAERGELLGFVGDRLVHREQLPASQLHDIGKTWRKESRFKTRLETGASPQ